MTQRSLARAAVLPLLLGACSYQQYQSDFGAAAVEGRQFLTLFWIFIAVCAFMYVLVMGFLALGIARSRRAAEANVVETGRHHQSDRKSTRLNSSHSRKSRMPSSA